MCDICNAQGVDFRKWNGHRSAIISNRFYSTANSQVSSLNLCYLHDIELFSIGERRLIEKYPVLLRELGTSKEEMNYFNPRIF